MEQNHLLAYLLSPRAIRDRCGRVLDLAQQGKLAHFHYHPERLQQTVDYVITVIKANYPDLHIPYHSRWRHFETGGMPRLSWIETQLQQATALERGRILFDLVIASVLLDAGAGPDWHYHEPRTNQRFARSEGRAFLVSSPYVPLDDVWIWQECPGCSAGIICTGC